MGPTAADRRQFGRREIHIKAAAVLPGHIQVPCIIENLSEGGALLFFCDGAAPTQSFRLSVDGTDFNLLCEVRHRGGRKIGIRFVRLAEGIALCRHVLRPANEPAAAAPAMMRPVAPKPVAFHSVREFRRAVLGGVNAPGLAGKQEPVPAKGAVAAA